VGFIEVPSGVADGDTVVSRGVGDSEVLTGVTGTVWVSVTIEVVGGVGGSVGAVVLTDVTGNVEVLAGASDCVEGGGDGLKDGGGVGLADGVVCCGVVNDVMCGVVGAQVLLVFVAIFIEAVQIFPSVSMARGLLQEGTVRELRVAPVVALKIARTRE
jgi:hypothetical protein